MKQSYVRHFLPTILMLLVMPELPTTSDNRLSQKQERPPMSRNALRDGGEEQVL